MPTPKKLTSRSSKKKGKIVVKKNVEIRKKSEREVKYDTMMAEPPRDNGVTFRVKIKKK